MDVVDVDRMERVRLAGRGVAVGLAYLNLFAQGSCNPRNVEVEALC